MSKFLTIQNLDISFQSSNKNLKTVKNFNLNLSIQILNFLNRKNTKFHSQKSPKRIILL